MEILAEGKNLWLKLNVRWAILTSLSLQVFLIFFAPIRKRCSNRWFMVLIWSAYLVADYAVGLNSKALFTGGTSQSKDDAYGDLTAFWAPFLLLHLGGPDTITAFAVEDNELWRRHLLNLLFQLGATGYVFYQSFPTNKLIVPTILLFIGGTTKYIERTLALYLASSSKFRDSMLASLDTGQNYAKLMEVYYSKREANIPVSIEMDPVRVRDDEAAKKETRIDLDDREVIKHASSYYTTFRGLLVDLIFSFRDGRESREFFSSLSAKDAFRVIEAELNFFYDVLYTKAAVVHRLKGYLFRALPIGSIVAAFAHFYVLNKHGFHKSDIAITYTLLLGAVGLEFVALIMLICSDWTIAKLGKNILIKFLLKLKSESLPFALHMLHARWSKCIRQYNLIDSRLERLPKRIEKLLGSIHLGEFLDYLEPGPVIPYWDGLGELIFNELKQKSALANDSETITEMCAARGDWALEHTNTIAREGRKKLLPFISDVDYDESLLLWHIATDICYHTDIDDIGKSGKDARKISKVLSDYVLHLMIKEPGMMSEVAKIGHIRLRYTCAEMDRFISEDLSDESERKKTKESVCQSLLTIDTEVKPADMNEDRIKSALYYARILAKELSSFGENKWVIASKVWVELLAYAAIRCRPYMHAQQLSKGGELVSLVWLLMVQLGLSEQFRIAEHVRAKLISEK